MNALSKKYALLDELYATLPTISCRKLCGFACGPIQASRLETHRVEEKTGFVKIENRAVWQDVHQFAFRNLPYLPEQKQFYRALEFWSPDAGTFDCQFFMPTIGTCRVYLVRPLICRLWGCVDNPKMRCSHNCKPTPRYLTNEEAKKICEEVIRIQESEE